MSTMDMKPGISPQGHILGMDLPRWEWNQLIELG